MAGTFEKNKPIYGAAGVSYSFDRVEFVPDGTAFDANHLTAWDFGDGSTVAVEYQANNLPTHTWTSPAVYELTMTYLPEGETSTVTVTRLVHVGVGTDPASLQSGNLERNFVLAKASGPDLAGRLCFFMIPNVGSGSSVPNEDVFGDETAAFADATKAIHELFRDTILRLPGLSPELLTDGLYGVFPRDALYLGTTDQLLSRAADMREILTKAYGANIAESVPAGLFSLFFDIREDDGNGNDAVANQYRVARVILPQHDAASIDSMLGDPGLDLTELGLAPSDLTLYFIRVLIQKVAEIISDYVAEWIEDPDEIMTVLILNTEDLSLSVRILCRYVVPGEPAVECIVWRQIMSQWSVGEFASSDPISAIQMYHDSRDIGMNILSNKEIDVLLEEGAYLEKKAVSLNNKIYVFDAATGVASTYGDTSVDSDIPCYVATKGGGMVVLNTATFGGSPFMGNMQLAEGMFNPTTEARNKYPGTAVPPETLVLELEEPSTNGVTVSVTQEGSVLLHEYKTEFDGVPGGASLVIIDPEEIGSLS